MGKDYKVGAAHHVPFQQTKLEYPYPLPNQIQVYPRATYILSNNLSFIQTTQLTQHMKILQGKTHG